MGGGRRLALEYPADDVVREEHYRGDLVAEPLELESRLVEIREPVECVIVVLDEFVREFMDDGEVLTPAAGGRRIEHDSVFEERQSVAPSAFAASFGELYDGLGPQSKVFFQGFWRAGSDGVARRWGDLRDDAPCVPL